MEAWLFSSQHPFNWASPSRLINPTVAYKYAQLEKRADTLSTAGSLRCFNQTGCNNSSICALYAQDQVSLGLFCYFVFNRSFQWGHARALRISVPLSEARTAATLLEFLPKSKLWRRTTLKTEESTPGTHADKKQSSCGVISCCKFLNTHPPELCRRGLAKGITSGGRKDGHLMRFNYTWIRHLI